MAGRTEQEIKTGTTEAIVDDINAIMREGASGAAAAADEGDGGAGAAGGEAGAEGAAGAAGADGGEANETAGAEGAEDAGAGKGAGAAGADGAGNEGAPAGEAGGGGEGAGSAPALYAGKYKTTDDLLKGVENAKQLLESRGVLTAGIDEAIELAKETGNYKPLEKIYGALDQRITEAASKTRTDAGAGGGAEGDPNRGTRQDATPTVDQVQQMVRQEMSSRLQSHPIQQEFEEQGEKFPTTAAEFAALRKTNLTLYGRLENVIREIGQTVHREADEYVKATGRMADALTQERAAAKTHIKAMNDKYRLGLSDAQIDEHVTKAEASEDAYTNEHGARVARKGGLVRVFNADALPGLIDKAVDEAKAAGRAQHAADLKAAKQRGGNGGPSNAQIPGRSAPAKTTQDIKSQEDAAQLSGDDLNGAINNIMKE